METWPAETSTTQPISRWCQHQKWGSTNTMNVTNRNEKQKARGRSQFPRHATCDWLLDPDRNAYIWHQHMGTWNIRAPPLSRDSPNGNYQQWVSLRHLLESSRQMEWSYSSTFFFSMLYNNAVNFWDYTASVTNEWEYGAFMKSHWEAKTRVLADKPA